MLRRPHNLPRQEVVSFLDQLIWCSFNFRYKIKNYSTQVLVDATSNWVATDTRVEGDFCELDSTRFNHSPKLAAPGESYSVLQASCFQHWFKNWQEKRKCKLTASTFGQAVGFCRGQRVQLWLEKIGAREPFMGNLATCWSNMKEEEALERYKLISGNSLLFPEFQVCGDKNMDDDWLAASPDGVLDQVVYELSSGGMLEVKCPFFGGDMKTALPWNRIPLKYVPQAQGLMEIMDRGWMDFYVWTPNGSSLFRMYRDPEYWDILKVALSDFWWKHIQPAREIYCRYEIAEPFKQLSSFVPAPRHELFQHLICKSKHIVDDTPLLVREIHGKLQN